MKITVTEDGKIIKEYLLDNGFSTSQIRTLKRAEKGITVNGEPSTVGRLLKNGDILELNTEDTSPTPVEPADIPLDILYEDDDILCVNKPKGLATHPHGQHTKTLANAFVFKYPTLVFRPISRLDANTSGIVLIAKNRYVSNLLASEISCGSIKKTYIAILDGIPPEKAGTINAPIARKAGSTIEREVSENGKEAITDYSVLAVGGGHALVEAHPRTGRTHQLRVHFSHIGCPIHGDGIYGADADDCKGHVLHARQLSFIHPRTNERITVTAPPPQEFIDLCERYRLTHTF